MSRWGDNLEMVGKYEATIATLRAEITRLQKVHDFQMNQAISWEQRAESAEAELASVRGDAGRYVYLRDGYDGAIAGNQQAWWAAYNALGGPYVAEYIDAQVDAAISGEVGNG